MSSKRNTHQQQRAQQSSAPPGPSRQQPYVGGDPSKVVTQKKVDQVSKNKRILDQHNQERLATEDNYNPYKGSVNKPPKFALSETGELGNEIKKHNEKERQ